MGSTYWEYRTIKETIELIMRLAQQKQAEITTITIKKRPDGKKVRRYRANVGHDPIMRLSIATEGFGLLGERDPVTLDNVRALTRLYTMYEYWIWEMMQAGYSKEEAKEALKPILLLIKQVESGLYSRSYTGESVVAPLSYVLAKTALRLKREAMMEAEAIGASPPPTPTQKGESSE